MEVAAVDAVEESVVLEEEEGDGLRWEESLNGRRGLCSVATICCCSALELYCSSAESDNDEVPPVLVRGVVACGFMSRVCSEVVVSPVADGMLPLLLAVHPTTDGSTTTNNTAVAGPPDALRQSASLRLIKNVTKLLPSRPAPASCVVQKRLLCA